MRNPIKEIERFLTDRKINEQPYDEMQVCTNVVEELLELLGYDVPKEERDFLMLQWCEFVDKQIKYGTAIRKESHTDNDRIDALCDVRVFCIDATMKLKYDPCMALFETAHEINSRKQDPEQAKHWEPGDKWQKDRNQDPATLYKADYDKCKL